MSICKGCIHYEICIPYVSPNESFPEVEGGCGAFKSKVDFVEVEHGQWQFDGMGWVCSECGEYALLDKWKQFFHSDYCPVCGSKMDGEKGEREMNDKSTPKHPSYNCQRGMFCPTCDKALWVRVEIQGLFGKKKL